MPDRVQRCLTEQPSCKSERRYIVIHAQPKTAQVGYFMSLCHPPAERIEARISSNSSDVLNDQLHQLRDSEYSVHFHEDVSANLQDEIVSV